MTEESHAAMMQELDRVKLDADMRAIAENAMQHFASVTAEPSAVQIVAESQAEQDPTGGGGGMDAPTGMTVAPMVPEPYHPVSPFRLKFSFGSDGSYSGVTMEDADFLWCDTYKDENNKVKPRVTSKTASVGSLSLTGTVYLNITLDSDGKYSSSSVDMSSSGDMSVKLYTLLDGKVTKDYRHALVALCGTVGGGGGDLCGNFAYNPENHEIASGYTIIARTPTYVSGVTVGGAGLVYLEVTMSSSSYTATITTGADSLPSPTKTKTYIPLYQIDSNLAVTADYRGAPQVQAYEDYV